MTYWCTAAGPDNTHLPRTQSTLSSLVFGGRSSSPPWEVHTATKGRAACGGSGDRTLLTRLRNTQSFLAARACYYRSPSDLVRAFVATPHAAGRELSHS